MLDKTKSKQGILLTAAIFAILMIMSTVQLHKYTPPGHRKAGEKETLPTCHPF